MVWDPFKEMNRTFSLMLNPNVMKCHDFRMPLTDIRETESKVIAYFELPGANKEDIDLSIIDNKIVVKVQQKAEVKDEESYESSTQKFCRSILLPKNVIEEDATATYENGILKVEIPKLKKVVKKIQIN